jgi:hypothetical protein
MQPLQPHCQSNSTHSCCWLIHCFQRSFALVTLHELDREFLFIFGLASLSRYNILRWNELLEGKQSNLIITIQRYLKSMVTFFPLIIASYLHNKKIVPEFYPAEVTELK